MNLKTILVPFNGHDHELPALEYAFGLAEIYESHVDVWHISSDMVDFMVYSPYGAVSMSQKMLDELKQVNFSSLKDARHKLDMLAAALQFKDYSFHTATGRADAIIATQARIADLVVMTRSSENIDLTYMATSVLNGCGRPVIFMPPDKVKLFNGKTLIAWNGSREAACAVAFSLPYFERGEVWILSQQEGESRKFPLSAEDLAAYLRRHGVRVHILANFTKEDAAPSILNTAKTVDAGLIVMGAWSHNRLREYVLGGVTEFMLHNADLPVLMAR